MSYGSNCQARCNHPGSWFWRREVFTVPFLSIFFICSVFILLSLYKFYLCMYRARARVCVHIQIIYIFIYISISICRHIGSRVDVSYFYVIHSLYKSLII